MLRGNVDDFDELRYHHSQGADFHMISCVQYAVFSNISFEYA